MRLLRVVLAVAAVVLFVPSFVLAQTKVFNFSWYTECQNRAGASGNQGSAGIATLTPSASGGYQLRFSGPGNAKGSADVSAPDASGSSSIQNLSVPNACGFPTAAPTELFGSGTFEDPTSFEFDSIFQGGGDRLLAVGAAAKTIVVPTISSPASGATVMGTTSAVASVNGVSAGIPLTYHFSVDGAEVAAPTSTTLQASASWDSRTVADGSHMLGVAVADAFGTILGSSLVSVTIANGGGGGTLSVAVTSPHDGETVRGTSWVVVWVSGGTSGATYTYTVQIDGQAVATGNTTSTGPVSMPWNTTAFVNGTHALSVSVRDNAGKTGSTRLGVLIGN